MSRTHAGHIMWWVIFQLAVVKPHPLRKSSLHLTLYEVKVRSIKDFSILSFNMCILFRRMFLPTSYFWFLINLNLVDLLPSAIWKFRYVNSSSHRSLRSSLYNINACLYIHILLSGIARFAWWWISVCVSQLTFSLEIHNLHALADASLILLFRFRASPGKCQISEP